MEIEELRKTIDEADRQLKSCDDAFKGTFYTIYISGYRKTAHKSMTRYSGQKSFAQIGGGEACKNNKVRT